MNVLITGCSSGIGYELSLRFASEAHNVVAVSRNEKALLALKNNYPQNITIAVYDITNPEPEHLLQILKDNNFNHLDIIINNAGLLISKPFEEITLQDFEKSYATNVFAPAMLVQKLLPLLKASKNKKHIVNIGSMGGFQGSSKFAGLSAYSSSKGALCTLTECMAEELKEHNIAANCLCLGAVNTPMLAQAFPGYEAPVNAKDMADYIYNFAIASHHVMNGKIIPVSLSTP